jgi:hypothetical protein
LKTLKKTFLAFLLISFYISCENNDDIENLNGIDLSTKLSTKALKSLDDTSWIFQNYTINKIDTRFEKIITLEFDTTTNDSMSFSDTNLINSYFGLFKVNEGLGLITENNQIGTTLVGSNDEEAMTVEGAYYGNITKATYFTIKDSQLYLYLGDTTDTKTEIMIFSKK